MSDIAAFKGELMLLGWAESSNRGRTVTFLLDETEDEHPFKHFTIKSGKRSGQRFMAVLVQIDESEQPVHQEQKPSQIAAIICKDPQFWQWATERSFDKIGSEDSAVDWVKKEVGIDSRKELDTSILSLTRFNANILHPFNEYRLAVNSPL
jgi:hypothetical protein